MPSTAWEAAFIADEQVLLEGWPDKSKTRWVLNFNEHAAYTRLCTLVLDDVVEYVVVDTRDGFIGYETGSAAFSR